jgi:hypothetical protein
VLALARHSVTARAHAHHRRTRTLPTFERSVTRHRAGDTFALRTPRRREERRCVTSNAPAPVSPTGNRLPNPRSSPSRDVYPNRDHRLEAARRCAPRSRSAPSVPQEGRSRRRVPARALGNDDRAGAPSAQKRESRPPDCLRRAAREVLWAVTQSPGENMIG